MHNVRLGPLFALFLTAVFISGQAAFAKDPLTTKSIEGVWKVTKIVKAGVVNSNPQPILLIVSRGYYSVLRINGTEPRQQAPEPKDPKNLTDAEKIALYNEWAAYGASAGTYEIKGNTWINHNVMAKMVKGMTAKEEATITEFDGNSFVVSGAPGKQSDTEMTYSRIR